MSTPRRTPSMGSTRKTNLVEQQSQSRSEGAGSWHGLMLRSFLVGKANRFPKINFGNICHVLILGSCCGLTHDSCTRAPTQDKFWICGLKSLKVLLKCQMTVLCGALLVGIKGLTRAKNAIAVARHGMAMHTCIKWKPNHEHVFVAGHICACLKTGNLAILSPPQRFQPSFSVSLQTLAMKRSGPGLWLSARAAATILVLGGPTILHLGQNLEIVYNAWRSHCLQTLFHFL